MNPRRRRFCGLWSQLGGSLVTTESPKEAEAPAAKGVWGTILKTTPIVLTVLATALAGISSSEMTQSMYYRSMAAQHQSKAGDQWALFQAKRIRGTSLEMTVETIQSLAHPEPFDPAQIDLVAAQVLQGLEAAQKDKSAMDDSARKRAAHIQQIRERIASRLADDKTKQSLTILMGGPLP